MCAWKTGPYRSGDKIDNEWFRTRLDMIVSITRDTKIPRIVRLSGDKMKCTYCHQARRGMSLQPSMLRSRRMLLGCCQFSADSGLGGLVVSLLSFFRAVLK